MPKLRLSKLVVGAKPRKLIAASAALAVSALGANAYAEYVAPQQNIVSITYRSYLTLYTGLIQLGTPSSATDFFWGGTYCSGVDQPDANAIDIAYRALSANEPVLIYYNVVGGRNCWNGGIKTIRTF